MSRRFFLNVSLALTLTGALLLVALVATHAAAVAQPGNVAPQVWAATADGGETEFLVVLGEQADLGTAATISNRDARLRYVYDVLRKTASRSQAALRTELDAAGASYLPFYVVNALVVRGDRDLVTQLAAHPEVARIAANPSVRQPLPEPRLESSTRPLAPTGIEWNVARVNADDLWALGITGEGIVVAGQDTGYDWDHPALINQYRGYNGVGITATHDYNWHDAIHSGGGVCGADSLEPCDDHTHGTHTMGIIVGDDSDTGGSNQIGVAPGARWIGCRNMDQGYGTPARYIECFEFFLAPYPVGGDPSQGVPEMGPHVINNSWTCPSYEGCDWDAIQLMQQTVENVRAAGIVVVASAGNDGSACSTVHEPPAIYDAAFSVGATNSSDGIATFSSRGPVTVDGSGRLKPDVSAPGVGVYSCVPGTGYGLKDGTSMAAPHVVGMAALLWSAAPGLIGDVEMTEWLIARTARPRTTTEGCGGDWPSDVPNHTYGWGIVDALKAVQATKIDARAFPTTGIPDSPLTYTFAYTNVFDFSLSQVVFTSAIPADTIFAWAAGNHMHDGGTVTWTVDSLPSQATLTATLVVTVSHLPSGTHIVNDAYGVRASELPTLIMGQPMETVIAGQYIMLPAIFRNWSSGGGGGE